MRQVGRDVLKTLPLEMKDEALVKKSLTLRFSIPLYNLYIKITSFCKRRSSNNCRFKK